MCVFYQYLVNEASSRRSPLCLSDGDEYSEKDSRCSPLIQNPQHDVADSIRVLRFDDFFLIIVDLFYLP